MRKPRAQQRGAFQSFDSIRLGKDSPSCLADYFTWPQVALTHHVWLAHIETSHARSVKTALKYGWPWQSPGHGSTCFAIYHLLITLYHAQPCGAPSIRAPSTP